MSNPIFPKPEEKKETAVPAATVTSPSPTVLLSQTDAYIHERIKSQPKTRQDVDIRIEEEFNINKHRLSLPKELDRFLKQYTFHWIFKREQAISEACDVRGWVIVNRNHFPELPNHLFSVTGCIERGDMILGFMKADRAERLRREPGEKSKAAIRARLEAHKGNPDFYVPKDKSEDGDDSKVIGI